jgi:peroxiredoxin
MTLGAELDAFTAEFMTQVPAGIHDIMVKADLALACSGIAGKALQADGIALDFTRPDVHGGIVTLSRLLAGGTVVLSFYRGGWCPYCNLELRALQLALPDIQRLGTDLVAISSQIPDASLSTAEKNLLSFAVLSDEGSRVAQAFGIAFELATLLRPIYTRLGHALPGRNGGASWRLPIPAIYVIGADRRLALAFIDTDYRNRLEPSDVLAALAALRLAQAA